MNNEKFNKELFKAKLGGPKKVGELMINCVQAGDSKHAFEIHLTFCPGAIEPPTIDNLSTDHSCNWSPYGYCFTNRLGRNIEQFDPETTCCIWCEKLYVPPNTVDPWEGVIRRNPQLRLGELHRE